MGSGRDCNYRRDGGKLHDTRHIHRRQRIDLHRNHKQRGWISDEFGCDPYRQPDHSEPNFRRDSSRNVWQHAVHRFGLVDLDGSDRLFGCKRSGNHQRCHGHDHRRGACSSGLVVGFDTYQNGNLSTNPSCTYTQASGDPDDACDPTTVPYMAVGPGAQLLWENPWYFVNGNLNTQHSADYPINTYANSTHSYAVSVVDGVMTVTMDGYELFTGQVSLPPVAYLGFTASTGGAEEAVTLSNLTATVSAP